MAAPLKALERWLVQAVEAGVPAPRAMTLATATLDGRPSARLVTLKELDRGALVQAALGDDRVPCPEDWGAVRLVPDRVELWEEAEDRLHDRELFVRDGAAWCRSLLAP